MVILHGNKFVQISSATFFVSVNRDADSTQLYVQTTCDRYVEIEIDHPAIAPVEEHDRKCRALARQIALMATTDGVYEISPKLTLMPVDGEAPRRLTAHEMTASDTTLSPMSWG